MTARPRWKQQGEAVSADAPGTYPAPCPALPCPALPSQAGPPRLPRGRAAAYPCGSAALSPALYRPPPLPARRMGWALRPPRASCRRRGGSGSAAPGENMSAEPCAAAARLRCCTAARCFPCPQARGRDQVQPPPGIFLGGRRCFSSGLQESSGRAGGL